MRLTIPSNPNPPPAPNDRHFQADPDSRDWRSYGELIAKNLKVVDARGYKISRVTSFAEAGGGVWVEVLVSTVDGDYPNTAVGLGRDVTPVKAKAFIHGGQIVPT